MTTKFGGKYMAAQVKSQKPVSLFFGKALGVSLFTPHSHSEAAFVRNKWCLGLRPLGFDGLDMAGIDHHIPRGRKR